MPHRPKALVLTPEMAHQDPRVTWNLEILARYYAVTIAPGTDCPERGSLGFYAKHEVLPCGRSRRKGLRHNAVPALRLMLAFPALVWLAARTAIRQPRAVWEVVRMFGSRQTHRSWFFSVWRCLKMHAAVWPFIRGNDYDLVWCHEFMTLPTGLRYQRLHPRCKIVWDEHEIGVIPPLSHCQRLAAEACAGFVSVSDALLEYQIEALPALRPKAYCVPNVPTIIRPPAFTPGADRIRWIMIGMESPHLVESLRHFLGVWERHAPRHCTLDCFIMQNTTRSYVRSQAFDSARVRGVAFHDPLPADRLADRLRASDVGIAPYFLDGVFRFACPNKVGEYIHAGLAVLVNDDLEWYGPVIERFGCGISANLADEEATHRAIALLSDRPTVDGFKRRSCEAARAEWNYDTAVAPLMARLQDGLSE